ncbi:MAG: hypothetical protein ACK559_13855, partial [bacterium]
MQGGGRRAAHRRERAVERDERRRQRGGGAVVHGRAGQRPGAHGVRAAEGDRGRPRGGRVRQVGVPERDRRRRGRREVVLGHRGAAALLQVGLHLQALCEGNT